MKIRVKKQKSNITNKTLDMYFKDKGKKAVENKENLLETDGSKIEEDGDLILDELEEKEDCQSDEEIIENEIEPDNQLKVGTFRNI